MNAFTSVLCKEVREHRLMLVIIGALTVVIGVAPFLAEVPGVRSPVLPCLIAAFGVFAVSLTVAPSLMPSEAGEGFHFLGRIPVQPLTVFLAKIAFLMAIATVVGLLGFSAASLTRELVAAPEPPHYLSWSDLALMASPLIAGLWLIAVTCIIPRPLAALPAAIVIFVVIGAPVWWVLRGPVQPSTSGVAALAVLAVLAPLAAAWLGFRCMLSGGGQRRTAWLVVAALSCSALPAWGWSAWERWRYESVEPTDPRAEITNAYLSVDGSRAYLNVRNTLRTDWMPYSFIVDLTEGKVIRRGGPMSSYFTLASLENSVHWNMLATHETLLYQPQGDLELVDCKTGRARVVPMRRPSMQFPELLQADLRAACNGYASEVARECEIPPESRATGVLSEFKRVCRPLGGCALRDAAGREILYLQRQGRAHLGLFDPATNRVTLATGDWSTFADVDGQLVPLRWDSPDTITVLAHGKRIERLRFGTDWREVIFPRP